MKKTLFIFAGLAVHAFASSAIQLKEAQVKEA
jgi:hypothetical protein